MFALLIPTGSDHDRSRVPIATLSLITINVLIDVGVILSGHHEAIFKMFGFVAGQPHWWQFFTYMFLHAGPPTGNDTSWTDYLVVFLHIFGNMTYLWFAGSDL